MIVDANILLYVSDEQAPEHSRAHAWLTTALNGSTRVGLPWPSLLAFLRISTQPRVVRSPLSGPVAWAQIEKWLERDIVWIPAPTSRHAQIMAGFIQRYRITANLVPDAHLAALAVEHGVPIASVDTDFARFEEVRWINPLER